MGWGIPSDRNPRELLTLDAEERRLLTWADADAFVAPDTIELAMWAGCQAWAERKGRTPFEAVCRLHRLAVSPAPEEG